MIINIIFQFYLIPIVMMKQQKSYEEILSFADTNKYALHRTTLLEVSALDYMSEDGFYQNFGEYLNRYDTPEEELIANISVISLGKEEYARFIKEIGGNNK